MVEKKEAFVVLGPESSGCKFFTQVLINAGCKGESTNRQKWDTQNPEGNKIVWRRSFPRLVWEKSKANYSKRVFENIPWMVNKLRKQNYEVKAFVTTRDWKPMLESQLRELHIKTRKEGFQKLQKAYPHIFKNLEKYNVPFILVSYEAILMRKHTYLKEVLKGFNLEYKKIKIKDGNKKYYK